MDSAAEAYDAYLVPALYEPWSRELIGRAKIWRGDRALDVACRTGIIACRIAATGAQVTGLDPSAAALAQARTRAAAEGVSVTFVEHDALALPFPAASFDVVTCQQALQLAPDRLAAARELRRVLAPGGRAVVSCWAGLDHHPAYALVDEVATRHLGDGVAAAFAFGDEVALRKLLAEARFFAVAVETVTRTMRFPEPDQFVARTLHAAALASPVIAALDPDTRAARIAAAAAEATPGLDRFVEGEHAVFPMTAVVGVGRVRTD